MKLWIRDLTGKTLQVRVSEDAPVKHLLWRIEWQEGIPVER